MQIQVQVENGEKPDLDEVGPFAYRSLSTISKIIANQTFSKIIANQAFDKLAKF